jgi:hypothetical protein
MFVPCLLFQPSLMFAGKDRSLPLSGAPEKCFDQEGSGLTHKHQTSILRLARDKHSSFLQKFVNYRQKSFITFTPEAKKKSIYLASNEGNDSSNVYPIEAAKNPGAFAMKLFTVVI